jgi:hypothetical protein
VTWLIRLYPPAWRRRYGRELAEMLAAQPMSFRTGVDLVAGAVDAWLNPQSSTAVTTTDAKGAGAMLPKMLQLRSGGHGPDVTVADSIKAAAVTIGGTLALVAVLTGATKLYGKNPYFESLLAMGWLVPFLFSQHYTYLKGHPARVQAVLIGAPAVIVIAIALGNAWINNN